MSKRTHRRELERARAKRRAAGARRRRTRIVAMIAIAAMGLSVFAVALTLGRDDPGTPEIADDPAGGDQAFGTEPADDGGAAPTDPADPTDPATGDGEEAGEASYDAPQPVDAEPCPPADDAPEPTTTPYDSPPEMTIDPDAEYTAVVETTCGTIELALHAEAAPVTVNNFVTLARDGYYDGVPFHRVMNGFMVQGGDPTGTGTGCLDDACSERLPGYQFEDELTLAEQVVAEHGGYPRGTLAMANSGPDTNGSQFFIVQGVPGYPLPPQYAVFGEVVSGIDVVDGIAQGPTEGDMAIHPVRIVSITIDEPTG